MKRTTKIELLLRLIGGFGVLLVLYGVWIQPGSALSKPAAYIGLVVLFLAIASAFGLGPVGKRLKSLYVEENKKSREGMETKQPWEPES